MGNYSIKELEVITGIKAHTIRIWEQRYNILSPCRTQTNIRFYTEEDLKHLLNISLLNKNGYKISRIARMSDKQVKDQVLSLCESNFEYNNQIDALTVGMIEFDEDAFEKIISTNILRVGFENTYLHIIFPFLHRLGILWQTTVVRPAQEHFISNLIRQKIIVALDGLVNLKPVNTKKYMLFLPEHELHELGLLFMNFIIRARGGHTLYLGASVPLDDVVSTFNDYRPDALMVACTSYPGESYVPRYLNLLTEKFPSTEIIVSGRQVLSQQLHLQQNISIVNSLNDAIRYIEETRELQNSSQPAGTHYSVN